MANIDTYLTNGNIICYIYDEVIEQTGVGQSHQFEDFPAVFMWQNIHITDKNLRLRGRYEDTHEEFDIGCKARIEGLTIDIYTEEPNVIFQSFTNGKIVWNTDRPIATIYLSCYESAFNVSYIMHDDSLYADIARNKLCVSHPLPPLPNDQLRYILTTQNGTVAWVQEDEFLELLNKDKDE